MNKRIWDFLAFTLIVLSLSIVSFSPANAAFTDGLTNGLVAYYPFNGNANDESGNGNNGTVFGATLMADRFGIPNSAYNFNGVSDYINVPHSPSLNIPAGTSVTITAWVYRTNASWPVHIVGKRVGCGGDHNFYQLAIGNAALPPASVPLNVWSFVATTTEGTVTKDYVDGVEVASYTLAMGANNADLKIGTSSTCQHFPGPVDDVLIYNRALTPAEIIAIYNLPPGGNTLAVSPASGSYVSTQTMDVTLIIKSPLATMTGATATLDGGDVSTPFLNCAVAGTLIPGGETHRCGHVRGRFLGAGTHTFSATVTLSDGSVLTDTVTWDVLENTEP